MKDHVRQGCVRRPVAYRLALWPGALVAVFMTPAVGQDQPCWELGVGFSVISFAAYNGVDPQYATAERSAFSADGGFRYFNISEATFADSPLVKTNHSLIGGIAVAWIFARSGTPRK